MISAKELAELETLRAFGFFGEERADYRTAWLIAHQAASQGGSGRVWDYMPFVDMEEKKRRAFLQPRMSDEDMKAQVAAWQRATGQQP